MTIPNYGYATPIQQNMLQLSGISISRFRVKKTEAEIVADIRDARAELVRLTGQDFGYDLMAWHKFLLSDSNLAAQYTFDDDANFCLYNDILAAHADPKRVALLSLINETA